MGPYNWQVLNPSPSVAHLLGKMAIQKAQLLLTKHQSNKQICGDYAMYFLNYCNLYADFYVLRFGGFRLVSWDELLVLGEGNTSARHPNCL